MKSPEQLIREFKSLNNDLERWKWVKDNQGEENLPQVDLDNDDTCLCIDIGDDDYEFLQFDNYVGWSDGVEILLKAMGIKAESV